MSRRARTLLVLAAAPALGVLLLWGLAGLPDVGRYAGPYGDVVNAITVPERQATGVVTAVVVDIRGFDTLAEEFILFAAVLGTTMLLRLQRDEEQEAPEDHAVERRVPETSEAVRAFGLAFVGPTVLLGIYMVFHGHLTAGGGFQGGVILASAPLLVYLAEEYSALRRVEPTPLVELAEGAGAGGFALIGVAGLLFGGAFLENVLPLGEAGKLLSAGTMPLSNVAIALAVAGGFVLLLAEFLEQAIVFRGRRARRR